MPYVKGPAIVEGVSWEQFSAPAPEVAAWKPDPDTVPAAANVPDPRFNKGSSAEQLKRIQKRQRLVFGYGVDGSNKKPATSSTPNASSMGRWPISAPPTAVESVTLPRDTSARIEIPLVPPKKSSSSAGDLKPTSKCARRTQGTMESLSAQYPFSKPPNPPESVTCLVGESHHNTAVPDWALPLEQLLQETSSKSYLSTEATRVHDQSTSLLLSSTPPHLRRTREGGDTVCTRTRSGSKLELLDSKGPGYAGQDRTTDPEDDPTQPPKEVQEQKALLESLIQKTAWSSLTHQRYLQSKLISIMQDEMDMQGRATRRELHAMSENDFESYFNQTVAKHKRNWNPKQLRHEIEETN